MKSISLTAKCRLYLSAYCSRNYWTTHHALSGEAILIIFPYLRKMKNTNKGRRLLTLLCHVKFTFINWVLFPQALACGKSLTYIKPALAESEMPFCWAKAHYFCANGFHSLKPVET